MDTTEETKEQISLAIIARDIYYIRNEVSEIKVGLADIRGEMSTKYVTKDAFDPVRKLTYGATALLLGTIVTAIISLVVKH